ncbi:DUF4266 domain-containing protein [Akkermansiaceae bacterium]|jgi:hypothetical protein|nr:DUF4266 domain-containing protein [Akkermansiaceae bacterium]MDA7892075.1 DUF4266 domain-containing protein [Akkermansiaceae bacterium]MDA7934205.1 DUF4266 domain-containing protein [Akkermansiaceae bacterium]MDA9831695.1 DUF4266 domain-containing protein [Akkermansiaceae bacterium]MDB4465271.1 DUF4266 domain-containing protein [Akkermansiaceae bacterium]
MKFSSSVRYGCDLMKFYLLGPVTAFLLGACSNLGAGARDASSVLSRPDMQLDSSPLTTALDNHIYFSKEASSGGRSFGGGGCGCN